MSRTPGDFRALLTTQGGDHAYRLWGIGTGATESNRMDRMERIGSGEVAHPFHPVYPVKESRAEILEIHGTTVIAVKYDRGVLNVGDRRATANMAVMFDRAEKVIALDDYTLIAISGSFARSMEIVRYLKHAF